MDGEPRKIAARKVKDVFISFLLLLHSHSSGYVTCNFTYSQFFFYSKFLFHYIVYMITSVILTPYFSTRFPNVYGASYRLSFVAISNYTNHFSWEEFG